MSAALTTDTTTRAQAAEDQRAEIRKESIVTVEDKSTDIRKKRIVTAKRKEQNREAQKRYREKRKVELAAKAVTHGQVLNGEETFLTPNGIDGFDFSACIDAGSVEFGDDVTMGSGILPSWDGSSSFGEFSSLLYTQQTFPELSSTWQYTTPMAIRPASPSPVKRHELAEEIHSSPQELAPSMVPLPSPYRNHLRLNRLNLYAACHENLLQMGVSIEIANTRRCPSPFHQSPPPSSQEPLLLSHRISNRCEERLKPDLRPSLVQRSHAHEIYLDVYPFPKWRDKVIRLLALSPPAFDEMGLKRDLDRDGLICWGSVGRKGGGAPWDSRSWEAQKWFLEKWWFLTKDTGVDTQSEWWREMRGEDDGEEVVV